MPPHYPLVSLAILGNCPLPTPPYGCAVTAVQSVFTGHLHLHPFAAHWLPICCPFASLQKGSLSTAEVCEALGLPQLKGRKWHVQGSIAIRGEGLYEGLDWLANTLKTMQRTGQPTSVSAVGR